MENKLAREAYDGEEGGGFLGGETFLVTKALFATDARYAGGDQLQLHWLGKTLGDDGLDFDDITEFHPSWSVGKDWVSLDGGKTTQHPGGKKRFRKGRGRKVEHRDGQGQVVVNPGAYIQELLIIAMGLVPEGGADDIFTPDSSPLDASIWEGTSWKLEDLSFDFGGTGENAIGVKTKLMPVEYLGKPGDAGATAAAPAAAVPAAAPASSNGVLRAKVIAVAKASATFDDFQTSALGVDGVSADDALLAEIIDEANGIWATSK